MDELLLNYRGYLEFYIIGVAVNLVLLLWFIYKTVSKFGAMEIKSVPKVKPTLWQRINFLVPFSYLYSLPKALYLLKDSNTFQEMRDRKLKGNTQ